MNLKHKLCCVSFSQFLMKLFDIFCIQLRWSSGSIRESYLSYFGTIFCDQLEKSGEEIHERPYLKFVLSRFGRPIWGDPGATSLFFPPINMEQLLTEFSAWFLQASLFEGEQANRKVLFIKQMMIKSFKLLLFPSLFYPSPSKCTYFLVAIYLLS